MPVKIARSTPQPSFGLPELLVASHISRLASRDAAKSLLSTLISESSGECRLSLGALEEGEQRAHLTPQLSDRIELPLQVNDLGLERGDRLVAFLAPLFA